MAKALQPGIHTARPWEFGSVLEAQAINDKGYDPNGDHRNTPLLKIVDISAVSGGVVIHAVEGDQPKVNTVTVMEAKHRLRALTEMSGFGGKAKYKDDGDEMNRLINMFIQAIQDANNQIAMATQGHKVTIVGR